jgi:hypothetical protein
MSLYPVNCHDGRGRANQVMSVHRDPWCSHGWHVYPTKWYHTVQVKHLSFCSRVGTLHFLASCQAHASGCTPPAAQCRASSAGWLHLAPLAPRIRMHQQGASPCIKLLLVAARSLWVKHETKKKRPKLRAAACSRWIGGRLIFSTTWPLQENDGQKKPDAMWCLRASPFKDLNTSHSRNTQECIHFTWMSLQAARDSPNILSRRRGVQ